MTDEQYTRRRIVRAGAYLTVGITGTLSGCPSPGETVFDDTTNGGGTGDVNRGDSTARSETSSPSTEDENTGDNEGEEERSDIVITAEPKYRGWFDGVSNYDGLTTVYQRDTDTVSVIVGASGNDGNRGFRHPAIAIAVGTTVNWEWSGDGGEHNVVAEDGTFDSGAPTSAPDTQFSYQFTKARMHKYVCEPHRNQGMKGAVTVYEPDG